jgi:fucose 4-O-acetylase-like acetyltransferase
MSAHERVQYKKKIPRRGIRKMKGSTMQEQTGIRRCGWLDIMKLLSLFLVYTAHFDGMGRYGLAIFPIVPCLFFASGCTAARHIDAPFLRYAAHKAATIVWPYFTFGFLSLFVRVIIEEWPLGYILDWMRKFLYACRTTSPVTTLWFLPCLFFMSLYYYGLRRLLKNRWALLGVCFAISAAVKFIHETPVLPWGIDIAARYLVYYALGDFIFAAFSEKPLAQRGLGFKTFAALGTAGAAFLYYLYFYYQSGYFASLLGVEMSTAANYAEQFGAALCLIWCVGAAGWVLQGIPGLCRAGQATLVFCGVEQIVKTLTPLAFQAFGLTLYEEGGAPMILQAAGLLVIAYFLMAEPIRKYLPWMLHCPFSLRQKQKPKHEKKELATANS